jgi:two-component system, OmpR family, sensor kinase
VVNEVPNHLGVVHELRAKALHALNNPLGSILVHAELVTAFADGGRIDDVRQAASRIATDCERHARMLRDAFRAMEELDPALDAPCTLGEAVKAAVSRLPGPLAVATHGDAVRLPMPRSTLITVLGRLLDNAHENAASRVDITAREGVDGWDVNVSDDGVGLHGLTVEQALRPFVSAAASTRTGLGLWVAQALVRRHGGQLTLSAGSPGGVQVGWHMPASSMGSE